METGATVLRPAPSAPWIFATLLLVCGAVLAAGGLELALLGGSDYYLIAGAALVADGLLLWRGRRTGLWLYVALLVYTLGWSLWEVGLDAWALASRLSALLVLGAYLLLPHPRRGLS
jgi:quinoprotein glucose dehydrogenase